LGPFFVAYLPPMENQTTPELYTYPARIVTTQAREHPALEGIENPFVRAAEISSNRLDAYFTRMDANTTLRNYARAAAAGVSILDSHERYRLGVGYSYTGETAQGEDGATIVLSDWYTVPGIRFGGGHSFATTDDYIKAVEARIVRKISVGFYGGRGVCDICHQNYYSWDCPHIAGMEYQIEDENGRRTVVATVTIFDAELAEYSLVYSNATPGAALRKIEREIQEGRLSPESIGILERRYRIQLPAAKKSWPGMDLEKGGRKQAAEEGKMDYEKLVTDMRGAMSPAVPETVTGEVEQVRWLVGEVTRLRPLADEGRTYRADLVTAALAEGVRAYGAEFAEETYRGILESAPLATVKRMTADWKVIGDKNFPGGRLTIEPEAAGDRAAEQPTLVPDEAYAA
jgi:hypothetical protein